MRIIQDITGNPPSSNPIFDRLLNFMDDNLYGFTIFSKKDNGCAVTSEDDITEDLVEYLDDKQEISATDRSLAFKFTNQSKQNSKRTDIGVRLGRNYVEENRPLFCWIEAKRLPTPKEKDRDEREYVVVSQEKKTKKIKGNGGIQRFKEGKYAPELSFSIMIGYIQENSVDYWLYKINEWIKDMTITDSVFWNETDYLQKQVSEKCNRYLSVHNRQNDLVPITLHHFWLNLPING
jgi:hypothetical protein